MFTIKKKEMFKSVEVTSRNNFWFREESVETEGVTSEVSNLAIGVTAIELFQGTEAMQQYYRIMGGSLDLFGTKFPFSIRLRYDKKLKQVYPAVEWNKPTDEEEAKYYPTMGKKHQAQILRVFELACEVEGNEMYQEYASELRSYYKADEQGYSVGKKTKAKAKVQEEDTEDYSDVEL